MKGRSLSLGVAFAFVVSCGVYSCNRCRQRTCGDCVLQFRIEQNREMILFSRYGNPPQFAIWLEECETGAERTVFVTYCSGTGKWKGKFECPSSLARWYGVFQRENGCKSLPGPKGAAPDAVTGATPESAAFEHSVRVESGRQWVCWVEVNMSADFNETFVESNERTGEVDTDQCGQPGLLYRGVITAEPGAAVELTPYGYSLFDGSIERDLSVITTAKNIFKSVQVCAMTDAG